MISKSVAIAVLFAATHAAFANTTPTLDYALLKQTILTESIGSFDELLQFFKHSPTFKPLLENPVLNERSKALHMKLVTPAFPRIVMHGGNLTMMVLGDPRLDEAQLVEIIEFLPATRTYAFRAINFHAKGTNEEFIDDADNADFDHFKDPTFKDVESCSACHQMEAKESRPRWMTGPIRQTPFGEVNNTLHAGSMDFENWRVFQSTYADTVLGARYRQLKLSRMKELSDGSLLFVDQPNEKLSDFMDKQNDLRIARLIEASPNFSKYEPAIVASFFSCGEMSEFLPESEISLREAAVKSAMINAGRDTYAQVRIQMGLLDPARLQPFLAQTWRLPSDDPTVIKITDAEFLQVSDLPLEEILNMTARATSDLSLVTAISADDIVHFLPIDLTGLIEDGIDFSQLNLNQVPRFLPSRNQRYYPMIAKLRYLLEDSVEEKPIHWSISKSSPFGDSYDFGDHVGGLSRVLSDGLSSRFLADFPRFEHYFRDHKVTKSHLKISESDLCVKLSTAQRDLLK